MLTVTSAQWRAFTAGVRIGAFDLDRLEELAEMP